MSKQTLHRYAPEHGLYQEFDEFVDMNLSAVDDQFREEADLAWECHPTRYWDEDRARTEFREWEHQRLADFRADLWEQWKWGHDGEEVIWKSAETLEYENDLLRGRLAERDQLIARLKKKNRNLHNQMSKKDEVEQQLKVDLQIERETTAQIREAKRCPSCDGPLY